MGVPELSEQRARHRDSPRGWCARCDGRDRAQDRGERGGDDVRIDADAPACLAAELHLDVGRGGGVLAGAQRVLVVVAHEQVDAERRAQRLGERVDRAAAAAVHRARPDAVGQHRVDGARHAGQAVVGGRVLHQPQPAGADVGGLERGPDLGRADLAAAGLGAGLDEAAEGDLQAARQVEAVLALQHVGDAALAGLAVDAHHRFVAAADVLRVDGQVGHRPRRARAGRERGEALLDRVLVRARERREHQLAAVRVARVDRHARCSPRRRARSRARRRGRAAGRRLACTRLSASVTRSTLPVRSPLPNSVPSTRSAPAITASSAAATAVPRSLCGCTLSTTQSRSRRWRSHPLDLVGVDVGRRQLDRRRQVEHERLFRRRFPDVHHRLADRLREVELGGGEVSGEYSSCTVVRPAIARARALDVGDRVDRDRDHARPVEAEDDLAEERRGGVVDVHDRARRAVDRRERAVDQLVAGLGEHLDRDVAGNAVALR